MVEGCYSSERLWSWKQLPYSKFSRFQCYGGFLLFCLDLACCRSPLVNVTLERGLDADVYQALTATLTIFTNNLDNDVPDM